MTVLSRCAMVITVRSLSLSPLTQFCTIASVLPSTLLVASSNNTIGTSSNNARAIQISCLCPELNRDPLTPPRNPNHLPVHEQPLVNSLPVGQPTIPRWCDYQMDQDSFLTVSENKTGSWGIIATLWRKSCTPMDRISTPSTKISPSGKISKIRTSAFRRLLFPAPVLPITPIFPH